MNGPRVVAVSVDLDGIDAYRGLHGLCPRQEGTHAAHDLGVPRAVAFAAAHRVPLSMFAIGRDLQRERTADVVHEAARSGARVENHSWSHRYDLSRQPRAVIDEELERASHAIDVVTGRRPRGFRAPGYVSSATLREALRASDMVFDASSFPCPVYYLAKGLTMMAMRWVGRTSDAIVDVPQTQLAPRQPHDRDGLLAIPMAVTRRLRLPVIGTSLVAAGVAGARMLVRGCIGDPVISIELHAIDFLDANDGLDDVARHQWDLRIAARDKRAALDAAIRELRAADYRFVALEDIAP